MSAWTDINEIRGRLESMINRKDISFDARDHLYKAWGEAVHAEYAQTKADREDTNA